MGGWGGALPTPRRRTTDSFWEKRVQIFCCAEIDRSGGMERRAFSSAVRFPPASFCYRRCRGRNNRSFVWPPRGEGLLLRARAVSVLCRVAALWLSLILFVVVVIGYCAPSAAAWLPSGEATRLEPASAVMFLPRYRFAVCASRVRGATRHLSFVLVPVLLDGPVSWRRGSSLMVMPKLSPTHPRGSGVNWGTQAISGRISGGVESPEERAGGRRGGAIAASVS